MSLKTIRWKKGVLVVLGLGAVLLFVFGMSIPTSVLESGKKDIYVSTEAAETHPVAIVFGAGLKRDGTPSDVLKDRLQIAADLYHQQKAEKILVSGDNRFENYNEPEAMAKYLIEELNIPEADVSEDFAGRRTYDTCIRAKNIWGIEKAILVSQGYHLPRAIWTCRQLGVESAGVSASLRPYRKSAAFEVREWMALTKAFVDVYIWQPEYIGGEKETLEKKVDPPVSL